MTTGTARRTGASEADEGAPTKAEMWATAQRMGWGDCPPLALYVSTVAEVTVRQVKEVIANLPPGYCVVPASLLAEVADALDRGDRSVTLRARVRRAAG